MLIQLVNIRVKPGQRNTFLEAMGINQAGTRQEPGNLRFDVLSDPDDENYFSLYEVFDSDLSLESHRLQSHYLQCMAQISPIIDGEITKQFFTSELI